MEDYTSNTDILLHSLAWNPTSKFVAAVVIVVIISIFTIYFIACLKEKKDDNCA
ncbi:MAG: hypothetical protein QGG63_00175 [Candidatus Pacebacteria bacterium]|jgi:hypothetical protein|nr:hypothetical protein [Candidatus Paceibacterota bacterium]|tara:strand:+ start:53921 stop:54082 length:162 start_codon:yes stop_codon:yes gene_type:complete